MADRFIDRTGREVEVASVVEFFQLVSRGVIEADTLLFDARSSRWLRAGDLPHFPANSPPEQSPAANAMEPSLVSAGSDAASQQSELSISAEQASEGLQP